MTDKTPENRTADKRGVRHGEGAPHKRGRGRPFTPERAREAARKSASVRKAGAAPERMAASSAPASDLADGQKGVLVPMDVVDVVRSLNRAARNGDVQAARELRAWMAEYPQVDPDIKLEEQPAVVRQRLLRRLLAELGEEEGGQDDQASPAT